MASHYFPLLHSTRRARASSLFGTAPRKSKNARVAIMHRGATGPPCGDRLLSCGAPMTRNRAQVRGGLSRTRDKRWPDAATHHLVYGAPCHEAGDGGAVSRSAKGSICHPP